MTYLEVWSEERRVPMQMDSHTSPSRDRWVGQDG